MPTNQLLGVELAKVGTWDLAIGGRTTFTVEDFFDAVAASHDPDYGGMTIRPGHTDPRFDGEPALGRVVNLRVAGNSLLGDLVDLPGWLTGRIAAAYPERSIEGYRNVTSPSGQKYGLVLTSLALLGVSPPAMKGLADLPAAIAAGAVPIAASSAEMDLAATPGESERPEISSVTVTPDDAPPLEGSLMDPTALRTSLGLAADASDEDVQARLTALAAAEQTATQAAAEAEASRARIAELEANPPAPPEPSNLPAGTVAIDATQLEELRVAASQGAQAHATLRAQERDRFIQRHVAAGRLAPANTALQESLGREWDRDREAAERVAASLAVVMPTSPLGGDGTGEGTSDDAIWAALGLDKTGA